MKCTHAVVSAGDAYGFTGGVAYGGTDENRGAHGGVVVLETCRRCGCTRQRASNGRHAEYGPWTEAEVVK